MSSRRLQESLTDQKAIRQEAQDWGMNEFPDNYGDIVRKIGILREKIRYIIQKGNSSPEKIFRFRETQDNLERLKQLSEMGLDEAIECISITDPGYDYLQKRLGFYEMLLEGLGTKTTKCYVRPTIEFKDVTPETINKGMLRDIMFAAMIGTPEMAIHKIANKKCENKGFYTTHMPLLKAGIESGNIGITYPFLIKLYQQAKKCIEKKHSKQEIDPDELEHKAVLLAADWLADAMNYNDPMRGPNSPYTSSLEEAVAWSRLGPGVKRQLRGMRRKIQGIDLHNIQRFIGKSGDSRYAKERRQINREINEHKLNNWSSRLLNENQVELPAELEERKSTIDEKYKRTISLAEKAIWLHFKMKEFEGEGEGEGHHQEPAIDWINNAQIGLINWTYKALLRGVTPETAFSYAKAAYTFPKTQIDRELIKQTETLTKEDIQNIHALAKITMKLGIETIPIELLKLSHYPAYLFQQLIEKGYTKQALLNHPWLSDRKVIDIDTLFPFQSSKGKQDIWCVTHAIHVPEAWHRRRLGDIILRRLNAGIDKTLHDATYWLKEFDLEDEKHGTVYRDHETEMALLYSLTEFPEKLKQRIPQKKNKYTELFSSDATELIYEAILTLISEKPITIEKIQNAVIIMLLEYNDNPRKTQSLKTPLPKLEEKVNDYLYELKEMMEKEPERGSFPKLIGSLRETAKQRKEYIDTAQKWLSTHSTAPRELLTIAWANRDLALADGCSDNPRAIKQWADLNALRASFVQMENDGSLPSNIDKSDIMRYRDWLNEIIRCYDGRTAIKTLSELKLIFNPDFEIPPMKINLGNGWVGEILLKNDPRGTTIGYDTGCCMTLGGISRSCIRADYKSPLYGFFALYRDEQIVAQSLIYTNKKLAPDTIVCDNIETNEGRDKNKVVKKYQDFFSRYLKTLTRRDHNNQFRKINIGTGYTDVGISHLKLVDTVPTPLSGTYTDAKTQRALLEIDQNEIKRLKQFSTELASPSQWEEIRNQIMDIEERAFKGKGYSENQLESEFTHPQNIAVVLKDGDKVIGYSTAIASQDKDTLYISSTALLPEYQGQGLVADILQTLEIEAQKQGYKYLDRHIRVDNGYAEKIKQHYTVVEEGKVIKSPHGLQQYLKTEITDHRTPRTLDNSRPVEQKPAELEFGNLTKSQIPLVLELEKSIYPPALCQGQESFEEDLEFDPGCEYENASFLLLKKGEEKSRPIGYAVAYIDESEIENDYVLYVSDAALLPEYQKKGYGKQIFERLAQTANSMNVNAIEFHARGSTSYSAITQSQEFLQRLGFKIVYDKLIKDYFEGTNEKVHLLRLEKIEKAKKAA